MSAYGYDDEGEREHDCCDRCGSGSCPGSGSQGEDACTDHLRRRPAPPLSPEELATVQRFETAPDALDEVCGETNARTVGTITRTFVCDLPSWHPGAVHCDLVRDFRWAVA